MSRKLNTNEVTEGNKWGCFLFCSWFCYSETVILTTSSSLFLVLMKNQDSCTENQTNNP